MTSKPNVFISYSHNEVDSAWIRDFVHHLKERDLNVWFDESELNFGDNIATAIEEALRKSDIFVTVLSPSSVNRPNVLFELGAAIALGKRVITIVPQDFDRSMLPPLIRERKFLTQDSPEEAATAVVSVAEK